MTAALKATKQAVVLAELAVQGYSVYRTSPTFTIVGRGSLDEPDGMGSLDLRLAILLPDDEYGFRWGTGEATIHKSKFDTQFRCNFGPSTSTGDPNDLVAIGALYALAAEFLAAAQKGA
jgi:hypothetical protein